MHCHAIPCHPSDFGSPVFNLQGRTREEPLPTSAKGATKSQVERHEKTQTRSKITPGSSAGAGNSESASSRGAKCQVNFPETHVMIVMLQVLKWRRLTAVYDQSEEKVELVSLCCMTPGG